MGLTGKYLIFISIVGYSNGSKKAGMKRRNLAYLDRDNF